MGTILDRFEVIMQKATEENTHVEGDYMVLISGQLFKRWARYINGHWWWVEPTVFVPFSDYEVKHISFIGLIDRSKPIDPQGTW